MFFSVRLIQFIEAHAESLTREVVEDLSTNEDTPSFHRFSKVDLEPRIFRLLHDLGNWICDPNHKAIRAECEERAGFVMARKFP